MTREKDSSLPAASGPGKALSREEARSLVDEIRVHLESARALLLRLYEGEGWTALGYNSWRQCVLEEFGTSESQLYRELSAARIEAMASLPIGSVPESHVRAVREIYKDEAETARVLELAWVGWPTTAKEIQSYAAQLWVCENLWGTRIYSRMMEGEMGSITAYQLGSLYLDANNGMREVIELCSEPKVAERLVLINEHKPLLMQEVFATGTIPLYESVPLTDASIRDIEAWLGIDNAERRAMHVDMNQDYYDKSRELTDRALILSTRLAGMAQRFKELRDTAQKLSAVLDELTTLKEKYNHDKRG